MEKKNSMNRSWLMLMITSGAFFLVMFERQMGGSIQQTLTEQFGVTATQFSVFGTIFFYSYMVMQLVIGVLIDRIGPRMCVTAGLMISAVGCILMAATKSFAVLCLARLLIGIGVSYGVVAVNKIAASWFPPEKVGSAIGIGNIPGSLGSAFAQTGMAWLVATFQWQRANWIIAAVFTVYAVICCAVLRDAPSSQSRFSGDMREQKKIEKSTGEVIWIFFKNPYTYPVLIMGISFNGGIMLFANWSVPYFRLAFSMDNVMASSMASIPAVVAIFGIILVTQIAERIQSRKMVSIAAFACGVIAWGMFVFGKDILVRNPVLLIMVLVIYGLHNVCMPLIFCAGQEVNDPQYVGTSVGLCNFISTIGCIVMPMAAGFIIDHSAIKGISELGAYRNCFVFALLITVLGFVATLVMKETKCRNIHIDPSR